MLAPYRGDDSEIAMQSHFDPGAPEDPPPQRSGSEPARPTQSVALSALRDHARLLVAPREHPDEDPPRAIREGRALIERGVALLEEVQRHDEEVEIEIVDDPFADAFDATALPPPSTGPSASDLCFAGLLEMKGVQRQLGEAREEDELLSAVEAGRRKLIRAIRAVLKVAHAGSEVPEALNDPLDLSCTEVESALAARKLYARFRRSLRRPPDDTPEGVLHALRYAAGALAALRTDPAYAYVRATDRTMLRGLRERILEWARGEKAAQRGLELMGDVETTADLLRGINQRQEVRLHDRALVARLGALGPDDANAEVAADLARLEGLDDALDQVLTSAGSTTLRELWPRVAACLADLS